MSSSLILVVDDSRTIRRVVSTLLERHGYAVTTASDGVEALALLAQLGTEIDLILLDFAMPRMNGFQFCRALRENDAWRDLGVVLMSAKGDRIRDQFIDQTGAVDAIAKPFDAQALLAVVEHALRRSESWRVATAAAMSPIGPETSVAIDGADGGQRTSPTEPNALPSALSGSLDALHIGAILQFLQMENQTGLVHVRKEKAEVSISLRGGLIDLVQSRRTSREFYLGRYFVELGLVTPDDIDLLLRVRVTSAETESGPPLSTTSEQRTLGAMLVESGRVTKDQLREALARQSSELVYEIMRWREGSFEFRNEPLPALADSARLGLPVAAVVIEGLRRVDEWHIVERGLGSFDAVLQQDAVAIEAAEIDRLDAQEGALLNLVDGTRTVRDLIRDSHLSSFNACKILFQLLQARVIRPRPHG